MAIAMVLSSGPALANQASADVPVGKDCDGAPVAGGASIECETDGTAPAPAPVYVSVDPATLVEVPVLAKPASRPPCYWTDFVEPRTGLPTPVYTCGQQPQPPAPGEDDGSDDAALAAARRAALRLIARGGRVAATPSGHGLANLETFFWVQGIGAGDSGTLTEDGFTLRIRAFPENVWWDFGDGAQDRYGLGRPGQDSDVSHAYARRGRYTVRVWIGWRVEFTAEGVVRQLPGAFQTSLTRPVAVDELRAVLTG
jgi:hypothetical protein